MPAEPAAFQSLDPRLKAIAAKVLAGERLDFADGITLYGTSDILAVGWLANHVRESAIPLIRCSLSSWALIRKKSKYSPKN